MTIVTPARAASKRDTDQHDSQVGFADLGVPSDLVSTLKAHGITAPFAIQTLAVADGCAGLDLCGKAPTGSGKTIAFGIPLVMRAGRAKPKKPTGLVLVPTRELAGQVCAELAWLGHGRKLRVAAVYGGAGFGPQLRALRQGVDVLVACPGRLTDLLERREVDLGSVEVVVVDEADRMADMGFLPAVRNLLDRTPETRQTLLFSATLDGAVDALVRRYQQSPVRHELPEDPAAPSLARHLWWRAERDERVQLCADIVKLAGPTIVFCKTKHGSDNVHKKLTKLGVRAQVIHGNRSQSQRERALADFADGRIDALIATDVVARGIHVDDVACVLNFDLPHDEKDYVHRAGRTARAGAAGSVVTFVSRQHAREAAKLQRAVGPASALTTPDRSALALLTPRAVSERAGTVTRSAPRTTTGRRATTSPASPVPVAVAVANTEGTTRGAIKWFDPRRGFGFIERPGCDDLFVHTNALRGIQARRVQEGQLVDFEIVPGRRGVEADNVRPAAGDA